MVKGAKHSRKASRQAPRKHLLKTRIRARARPKTHVHSPKAAGVAKSSWRMRGRKAPVAAPPQRFVHGPSAAARLQMAKLHPPVGKGAHMETTTRCVANRLWQKQLLTDATVRKWLIRTMGEHAIHVIQEFTQDLSDEQIAQKAGIRASDVRVVLNKLHSYSLATYARNRDKNSGWYSYVWHLNNEHLSEMVDKVKREAGETAPTTNTQAEDGQERYFCSVCGPASQVDFERASALLFRCEQCGGSMAFLEQKKQNETTISAPSG